MGEGGGGSGVAQDVEVLPLMQKGSIWTLGSSLQDINYQSTWEYRLATDNYKAKGAPLQYPPPPPRGGGGGGGITVAGDLRGRQHLSYAVPREAIVDRLRVVSLVDCVNSNWLES